MAETAVQQRKRLRGWWQPLGGAMAVLLLAGCGSSKVAQCNTLAEVVNQTQAYMQEFETDIQAFSESAAQVKNLDDIKAAASEYTLAVDKVVTNLDGQLVNDLESASLQDETLSAFRDEYVEVVRGFSTALQEASRAMELVVAVDSEDALPEAIERSQEQTVNAVAAIETLSQTEAQLINEVNAYCGAAPTSESAPEPAPAPESAPEPAPAEPSPTPGE